ncbi:hypothetical protein SEA_CELAENA_53 [Microbacterium phage Celaena]|uniref:hypothetical protein n=1 Tax=Microbacterium phage Celaena TaxID=2591214 RepID=UPI001165C297|nr:hypothetical protein QDW17_gp53 [Microbacterium phage Celaena]QDH92432.1 hypothetical protein SEA_CELAENA_53 [Microbacterium phage Celaena]
MTDFTARLDEKLPKRTAGALPSTRTFGMVTEALESQDVEVLSHELQHTRAHYQSLEYMLNNEEQLVEVIKGSWEAGAAPEPTTIEEAIRLTVRAIATEALEAAYDTAHQTGFFIAVLGMNVQEALQTLYSDLDYSDPERELSEAELQALATPVVDTDTED